MGIRPLDLSVQDCWQEIGIFGDRSCPRLESEIHCRNCEIYRTGGHDLLDRPLPEDYRREITFKLQVQAEKEDEHPLHLVLFRIGGAWLAMASECFVRTLARSSVMPIPGRSNQVFRGLVNTQGDLRLCVSLGELFKSETEHPVIDVSARVFPRMLEIRIDGERWIFEADEVVGAIECFSSHLEPLPSNLERSLRGLVKSLFVWQGLRVALVEPARLRDLLKEAIT